MNVFPILRWRFIELPKVWVRVEFNNCFLENYIVGPVIYNFEKEINSSSDLGKRFMWYENYFKVNLIKDNLWMPEDCIQYIHIHIYSFSSLARRVHTQNHG